MLEQADIFWTTLLYCVRIMPVPADAAVRPADIAIVVPSGSEEPMIETMIESCRGAVGRHSCMLDDGETDARWMAIVRWGLAGSDDAGGAATIEFRPRESKGPPLETRHVAFEDGDSSRERWTAIGLVVAAFVAARQAESLRATAEDVPHQPDRKALSQPLGGWRPWTRWALDVAVAGGTAFASGPYRYGALVRGALEGPVSGLALGAGLRYAERPGNLSVQWTGGSLGLSYLWGAEGALLSAEIEVDGVVEYVSLSAEDLASGASDRSERWRAGPRLAGLAIVRLSSSMSVLLGVEGSLLRPRLIVRVGGTEVASEGFANLGGFLGVRFVP